MSDIPCWEIIGDELVVDTDMDVVIKQITQRMMVFGGWRVLVTWTWRDKWDEPLRREYLTFRVDDGFYKWDRFNFEKARKIKYPIPENVTANQSPQEGE